MNYNIWNAILKTPSYFQFYVAKQFSFNYRTFYKYYSTYLDFSQINKYLGISKNSLA